MIRTENGKWKMESGKGKKPFFGFRIPLFVFVLSILHYPFSILPVYGEASKSSNYTLDAGGFTAGGTTTSESPTIKAQAGAIGDFAGTATSTESTTTTVNPGLVQVLTAEKADTSYPFDIKEVFAKESLTGEVIQSSLWQKDNDPHFYWTVYGPTEGVAGYSFALDAIPDEVVDAADSSFSYSEDDIVDGKHLFRVIAQSTAGKWGREGAFEIWIDAASPSVIAFAPGNKVLMNNALPQIQIDLKDEASGIDPDSVALKVNRSQVEAVFDPQSQRVSYTPASPLREGSNSITFDVQDQAKNVTATLIWSFNVDTQPPTGKVTLNNGDVTTTSIAVKIDIEAEDATTSVKEMMISNQSDFAGGQWEPFSTLKDSWQLAAVSGERMVYVKFKDEAGNESIGYIDSIELVIIAPETTITDGPSGVTEETAAAFTFSASEADAFFRYQMDAEEWSDWTAETSAAFSDLKQGNHYFSVKAGKDVDGNGTIDPDEEDPTPATRTWSVSASGGTEAGSLEPEKPVKYWYKE